MDVRMPRLDGIEVARRLLSERPSAHRDRHRLRRAGARTRAAEAGVFGYLVKPFREDDLIPAVQTARARFRELAGRPARGGPLAEALESRKVVERAKGMLMAREGLAEDEAYARLRRASQRTGRPMRAIAEALVATLEGDGPPP